MQAERAPYVGIVLALMILCVETIGFITYASKPAEQPAPAQHWHRVHHCLK
jgi:hypothetical protein